MTSALLDRVARADFTLQYGAVRAVRSDYVEANGPMARVGSYCSIANGSDRGGDPIIAEVVAIDASGLRLVPLGPATDIALGARVTLQDSGPSCPDPEQLAGRAIDALGRALDDGPRIPAGTRSLVAGHAPLHRVSPSRRLQTGIRAIDGLLPLAQGQKVGVFAPSGAGKSSLLEQICQQAEFDRVIFCQIGERGREVEKVWRQLNGNARHRQFTMVAAAADESPSLRVKALDLAISLAEQMRATGGHVLLLVDSVTRVAMALRELGIAAGEPPSARGYTANVFSYLPRQVERCGAIRSGGAITAIMSVLSETEDVDDPIVEMMKSVLDGHIVLSRSLAERRQFPAIDISRSVSRLAEDVIDAEQAANCARIYRLHATHEDARAMIDSGIYKPGSSVEIDAAIAARKPIDAFLRQGRDENCVFASTLAAMQSLGRAHGE